MDPFSITIGISGLIGLVARAITVTEKYVHEARHAKEAASDMIIQLNALRFNLTKLEELLKADDQFHKAFADTSVLVKYTMAYQSKLSILYHKLDKERQGPIHRLRWPFNAKEHQETLDQLQAFAQWIDFALTIDGSALLSKTYDEIAEVLAKQLEAVQLIEKVNQKSESIEDSLAQTKNMIQESQAAEQREKILNWISKAKPEQKHHDIRMPRVQGTGEWFLQEPAYGRWRRQEGPNVLWCHGMKGSGKSVIASLVIDRLREDFDNEKAVVAHVYFDYRDREHQSIEQVVSLLLKQAAAATQDLPQSVVDLYQRMQSQERYPYLQDLKQTLFKLCQKYGRVFIIIDALDEYNSRKRKHFLDFIFGLRDLSCVSIMVTSRGYPNDIKEAFGASPQIIIGANEDDLRKFLVQEIEGSNNLDLIDEDFKEEIVARVSKGAQKMFLLAALHIQTILAEPTAGEMEEALLRMPQSLHDIFEKTLHRINDQPESRRKLAMNILMWISHARRHLSANELSDVLAIKAGSTSINPRYRPSQKTMVDCCFGLVIVDDESAIIRLIHFSVQEFLLEHRTQLFPEGNETVAELCILYQSLPPFSSGSKQQEKDIQDLIHAQPFIKYASHNWGNHLKYSSNERLNDIALNFLRSRPQLACSYQMMQYLKGRKEIYWEHEEANSCNGLHACGIFGLSYLATRLLEDSEVEVDDLTRMGTTALIKAASGNHIDLVRTLLELGADYRRSNWYGTAIHCAAEAGQTEAVLELLKGSIPVDIRDTSGRTALHCAAAEGHLNTAKILLQNGADTNAKSHLNYTPLHYAVHEEMSVEVVQLMLAYKANPNTRSFRDQRTPLHDAMFMCKDPLAEILLQHGADPNARDANGQTLLHLEVKQLCGAGTEIDEVGVIFRDSGSHEALQLLLRNGADTELVDDRGRTPLCVAIRRNNQDVVKALLNAGAKVGERSKNPKTPIGLAMSKRFNNILRLLLERAAMERR